MNDVDRFYTAVVILAIRIERDPPRERFEGQVVVVRGASERAAREQLDAYLDRATASYENSKGETITRKVIEIVDFLETPEVQFDPDAGFEAYYWPMTSRAAVTATVKALGSKR